MKTSTLIMRRSLRQAVAAAEIGSYDLLLYYTHQMLMSVPASSPLFDRILLLHYQVRVPKWRRWYEGLIRLGYRPVRRKGGRHE